MNTAVDYWPGTNIVKSPNNGFTMGLRTSDADWAGIVASSKARMASTAFVERKRDSGIDPGAIYGISQKADQLIRQHKHGGAYSRAAAANAKKPKQRGPEVGYGLNAESMTGKLRALLASGPKTGAELSAGTGVKPTAITGMLKNDVRRGRVIKSVDSGEPIRYSLPEAA